VLTECRKSNLRAKVKFILSTRAAVQMEALGPYQKRESAACILLLGEVELQGGCWLHKPHQCRRALLYPVRFKEQ